MRAIVALTSSSGCFLPPVERKSWHGNGINAGNAMMMATGSQMNEDLLSSYYPYKKIKK